MEQIEGYPEIEALPPGPKGKHIFGTVTINDKGQIVIPKKARKIMGYKPGDNLLILGDERSGLAIMKVSDFIKDAFEAIRQARKKGD